MRFRRGAVVSGPRWHPEPPWIRLGRAAVGGSIDRRGVVGQLGVVCRGRLGPRVAPPRRYPDGMQVLMGLMYQDCEVIRGCGSMLQF